MQARELAALVGRWAKVRPVDGSGTDGQRRLRSVRSPGDRDWVEVAVVSSLDRVLRCETRDRRALELAGRSVMLELGVPEAMLRVPGRARVLVDRPLPVVLAVTASGDIEHLQRRQWVRARVHVPVEVVTDATRHGGGGTFRATAVNLSGGGARLRSASSFDEGEALRLTLWIPGGPIEVESTVLQVLSDGSARVEFDRVPEAVGKRLMRFVFDVQVRNHRLVGP